MKGDNRYFAIPVAALVAAVYGATAIAYELYQGSAAAETAIHKVQNGQNPPTYFGLQGTLMCIVPTSTGPIPSENGPVPTDHPVLSFGSSDTWVWLWDPERHAKGDDWASLAVRREDIQLVAPRDSANSCP